jgi:FkbM family methyltransferase
MKTKYKFLIAQIIFKIICFFKLKLNLNCKRNKINWNLDLSEAIDLSIYLFGKFEHEIVDTAIQMSLKKDQVIIDIGANIGVQTLQFASKFEKSKIFSIEPTDYAFKKMQNNIKLNPLLSERITVLQSYLTCEEKHIPKNVYSSWKVNSNEDQHLKHMGIKKSTNNSYANSIDRIVSENKITNVSFIKLDVDGPELDVLKSGVNFLSKNKPPIFMELAPYLYTEFGYTYVDLINFINSLGYDYYTINPMKKIDNIEEFILKIADGSSKNILIM